MKQTQIELKQKYKTVHEAHMENTDYYEDINRCEVCASSNLHFIQKQNGVIKECKDCEHYYNSRK